jgi:hypothetical protein
MKYKMLAASALFIFFSPIINANSSALPHACPPITALQQTAVSDFKIKNIKKIIMSGTLT